MKSLIFLPLVAISLFLLPAGLVEGRLVRVWAEEELFGKSDLVVVATAKISNDTAERTNLEGWQLIGIETTFSVSKVLKGDRKAKTLLLHHYRYAGPYGGGINSPDLGSFDPAKKQTFRLYLVREADGRYAPVAGQLDGFRMSVREITKS